MTLAGTTMIMSGGSRGIGEAIAVRAARDGANVVLLAKTSEPHPRLPGTIHTAAAAIEAADEIGLAVIAPWVALLAMGTWAVVRLVRRKLAWWVPLLAVPLWARTCARRPTRTSSPSARPSAPTPAGSARSRPTRSRSTR